MNSNAGRATQDETVQASVFKEPASPFFFCSAAYLAARLLNVTAAK